MSSHPVFTIDQGAGQAAGTTTCVTDGRDEILAAIVDTCIEIDEPIQCKSGIFEPDAERSIKITNSLQSMCDGPTGHLGTLDRLPSELISEIFSQLDLRSILEVRRVSRTVRQVVASSKTFKTLTTHAVDVLWSLVQLRLAHKYTLGQIVKALRETQCSVCHSSCGIFLFVPLLERTCTSCRTQRRRFTVLRRKALLVAATASQAYEADSWPAVRESMDKLETFRATVSASRWPDTPARVEEDMLLYDDVLQFCETIPSLRQTYHRMQTVIGYSQMRAITGSIEGLFVAVLPYDPIIDGVYALRACNDCACAFINLSRGHTEYMPDGYPFQVGEDSTEHRQQCMIARQLRA